MAQKKNRASKKDDEQSSHAQTKQGNAANRTNRKKNVPRKDVEGIKDAEAKSSPDKAALASPVRRSLGHNASKGARQLKIIPLGGLDGIGKNMTVFQYGDDLILVDAGLMFPDDEHPGVDLILPDYTYVLEHARNLRGIIITHGHEDHTGALPYLLKDLDRQVPVYGSKLTLGFIDAKFTEFNIKNQSMREVHAGDHISLGSFSCDFYAVNHSIPDAMGVFIRTPAANVLHTGDFKLDQTPINGVRTDFAALARFAKTGVDVMLSDSTNAMNSEFTHSEAEVGVVLRQIIKSAPQRVIIASFSSHIHRIQQICDAAAAAGRKVVVTGRSMLTNTQIARELGYLSVDERNIIDAYNAKGLPSDKVVVLCTGSQGEPLSALARMANGDHRTISIEEGDTVIFSASPVPGNETAVTRVKNALSKIGAVVYDKGDALVHVSGHAGAEELKLMLAMVQPSYLIPVHGEYQHLLAHRKLAQSLGMSKDHVLLLENGDTVLVDHEGAHMGEPVESGIVYVDGLLVGDISQVVLKDRQTLASEGIVAVVCTVSKRDGKPTGDPVVIMRGVSAVDDDAIVGETVAVATDALRNATHEVKNNPAQLRRAVRESLSTMLWNRCRRRPMIIPIIMEV